MWAPKPFTDISPHFHLIFACPIHLCFPLVVSVAMPTSSQNPNKGRTTALNRQQRHLEGRPGSQQLHDDVHRVLRRAMQATTSAEHARKTTQAAMSDVANTIAASSAALREEVVGRKEAILAEQGDIVRAMTALEGELRGLLSCRAQLAAKLSQLRPPLVELQRRIDARLGITPPTTALIATAAASPSPTNPSPATSTKQLRTYTDTAERILLDARDSLNSTSSTLEGRLLVVEDLIGYVDGTRRTLLSLMTRNNQTIAVNDEIVGLTSPAPSSPITSPTATTAAAAAPVGVSNGVKAISTAGLIRRRKIPAGDIPAALRVARECVHESGIVQAAVASELRDTTKAVEVSLYSVEAHLTQKVAENAAIVAALRGEESRLVLELAAIDVSLGELSEVRDHFKLPLLTNKARTKIQRSSGPAGRVPPEEKKRRGGDTVGVPGAARDETARLVEGMKVSVKQASVMQAERAKLSKVLEEVRRVLDDRERQQVADERALKIGSQGGGGGISIPRPPPQSTAINLSRVRGDNNTTANGGSGGGDMAPLSSCRSSPSSSRSSRESSRRPGRGQRNSAVGQGSLDNAVEELISGRGSVRCSPRIPAPPVSGPSSSSRR